MSGNQVARIRGQLGEELGILFSEMRKREMGHLSGAQQGLAWVKSTGSCTGLLGIEPQLNYLVALRP